MPGEHQRLLTLLEVADLLRLSPHTIRSMVRDHRLEPVRICRRLLFPRRMFIGLWSEAEARAEPRNTGGERHDTAGA